MQPLPQSEPEINKLFRVASKYRASDLYLHVGLPPMIRLGSVTHEMMMRPLSDEDLEGLLFPMMSDEQQKILADTNAVDFTYAVDREENVFNLRVSRKKGYLRLSACPLNRV